MFDDLQGSAGARVGQVISSDLHGLHIHMFSCLRFCALVVVSCKPELLKLLWSAPAAEGRLRGPHYKSVDRSLLKQQHLRTWQIRRTVRIIDTHLVCSRMSRSIISARSYYTTTISPLMDRRGAQRAASSA